MMAARDATDVLVNPDVTGVEIRDWSAYEPAIKAGYDAMVKALDELGGPVTNVRRRISRHEPAPRLVSMR